MNKAGRVGVPWAAGGGMSEEIRQTSRGERLMIALAWMLFEGIPVLLGLAFSLFILFLLWRGFQTL